MSTVPLRRLAACLLAVSCLLSVEAAELRIGIIGLDTSHATAFTDILNDTKSKEHVPGGRVVAAYAGGSPDIESSISRVPGYTATLKDKHGVRIVDSIPELCREVDAVMLLSVDGRPHLEQAKPVIAARKPLYVDKPMAGSLREAAEIFRLAQVAGVPVFSASSLRFARTTQGARAGAVGTVTNAWCGSPAKTEKTHPDLFWYGIHGCESLFTVMGAGCESVRRGRSADGHIETTGRWKGGRIGVFREIEGYGGRAEGTRGVADVGNFDGYAPLVAEVVRFFQTGRAPVEPKETLEIFAFMEADHRSARSDGAEVRIDEVLAQAGVPR